MEIQAVEIELKTTTNFRSQHFYVKNVSKSDRRWEPEKFENLKTSKLGRGCSHFYRARVTPTQEQPARTLGSISHFLQGVETEGRAGWRPRNQSDV